jgi:hypothetical protein
VNRNPKTTRNISIGEYNKNRVRREELVKLNRLAIVRLIAVPRSCTPANPKLAKVGTHRIRSRHYEVEDFEKS